MLARLLQITTVSLLLFALLWAAGWWMAGRPLLAIIGSVFILCGHALFLAAELVIVHRVHRDDPSPPATPIQLVRAWWSEVLTAPLVFCWRQPFRSRAEPDHLPSDAGERRGVLLVHGFVCNRGIWNPWMRTLRAQGVPFVAVNLEPVFGSIDRYADAIDAGWRTLVAHTGLPPVVVAHSMGGLATRHWWRQCSPSPSPHRVVTIGSPHHGTWLGRFGRSLNTRQMQVGCDWLCQLAKEEPADRYSRFVCFYSHCDNVVFPASTATLPGADNRHVPGQSHVHLAYHPQVLAEVLRLVGSSPGLTHRPDDGESQLPSA